MILAIQKAAQDKFRLHSQGMTLIELLLAMAVTLIIIGALVTAFISHTQTSAAEEARMEVQQNLRVTVDRLKHVFRHAGFGNHDSFQEGKSMSGDDPEGNGITVKSFVARDPKKNDFASDSVIITYGFKLLGEIDENNDDEDLDDDQIILDRDPSLSLAVNGDFKQYLSFYPSKEGNIFYEVDNVDNREITFTKDIPFSDSELDAQDIEV
ncbi:MAG: PilW family protein, partial [Desulfohalobiaceae bacterium]